MDCQSSKNLHSAQPKTIMLVVFVTLIPTILVASLLFMPYYSSSTHSHGNERHPSLVSLPPPHPIIKNACTNTLYPSLCFTTLLYSTPPPSPSKNNSTISIHYILEFTFNRTIRRVASTRFNLGGLLTHQDLKSQEKNALNDCTEMLDQTLYELRQAVKDLRRKFPASRGSPPHSYGNIKTLLSAAMTNENTCIDGFSDLEESNFKGRKDLKEYLQGLLNPISQMISNCLAMIKYTETINYKETIKNRSRLINNMPEYDFQYTWMMERGDRKMRETTDEVRPNVVVAKDGRGKHRSIQEAVSMAPNRSSHKFVIRIKAGTYRENVVIPRAKVNIVFVGDGMHSTVITGSKNFVDGFSTFTSATLTVVGDKFIARDLTIKNTAGPEKHQAVALRVNSNAAFYRCNITAYQDTLYAHSLRQFYRDCTIQGTVDFIFGNAAAILQNCLILVRKPNPGQSNMITAQGRQDPNQNTGISLHNCTIVAAPDFTEAERANFSTFLGRPWRNYSRTIIMKSYLGGLIHPQGWHKWNNYSTLDTVKYIEYMNSGPGSNTSGRVNWPGYKRNCSEQEARQFMVASFLHGADRWLKSTGFPLSDAPQDKTGSHELSRLYPPRKISNTTKRNHYVQ